MLTLFCFVSGNHQNKLRVIRSLYEFLRSSVWGHIKTLAVLRVADRYIWSFFVKFIYALFTLYFTTVVVQSQIRVNVLGIELCQFVLQWTDCVLCISCWKYGRYTRGQVTHPPLKYNFKWEATFIDYIFNSEEELTPVPYGHRIEGATTCKMTIYLQFTIKVSCTVDFNGI